MAKRGPKGSVWLDGESWQTGSEEKAKRIDAYVEWLLTPPSERVPASKRELSELLGVTMQTLRNYARDPLVQSELAKRGRAINRVERAGDVLDSLFRQATDVSKPSVQAAKVWLDFISKQEDINAEKVDLRSLSDEELHAAAMKLLDIASGAS